MKSQTQKPKPEIRTGYRALVGLNYGDDQRAEEGEIVYDLPTSSIEWLLAQGAIELVKEDIDGSSRT